MREFKFRLWDDNAKRWISRGESVEVAFSQLFPESIKAEANFYLEQYTGFEDEDGQEIYEGDIIWLFGIHLEVVWSQDEAKFDLTNKDFRVGAFVFDKHTVQHIKVEGNIHENPELLEVRL